MARIKKKGTAGATRNYYTRSQAVRKLQTSLADFRRLCIFKGIYPREPRSKKRVSKSSTPSTTFYYAKDIQFLLHEPLLAKFREQKALSKKIAKALGRNELSDAARWERDLKPRLRLDHVVKERYPTFVDALRDLDDALSLLFLFANLPSTAEVPAKVIARCQRLTLEFEHYLIRTHSLRKSFLSIKGIYYQATIQGQDVLWLVPYKFVQRTGGDVDFRIMATFVDFNCTLVGFVNFRLFAGVGLVYPPRLDVEREEMGAELSALKIEGKGENGVEDDIDAETNERAQAEADRLRALPPAEESQPELDTTAPDAETTEEATTTVLDEFAPIDDKADALLQPSLTADASTAGALFEPFTFFLSRETPRHPLEFILKAFGCKRVGWDTSLGEPGAYCDEDESRITHHIVDRPDIPLRSTSPANDDVEMDEDDIYGVVISKKSNERVPGRIYIQPQWVWDSINAGQLQRPDLYAPGATLPPHLSPWVKAKRGEYDPTAPLAEPAENGAEVDEEEVEVEEGSDGEEVEGVRGDEEAKQREAELDAPQEREEEDGGMDVQLAASDDDDDEDAEDDNDLANGGMDDWDGFASEDENEETAITDPARQAQAELEAEALGHQPDDQGTDKVKAKTAASKKLSREEKAAQEEVERRKMMMPRRKRKMYEKMVYSNARKDEETERLQTKRRKIERKAQA